MFVGFWWIPVTGDPIGEQLFVHYLAPLLGVFGVLATIFLSFGKIELVVEDARIGIVSNLGSLWHREKWIYFRDLMLVTSVVQNNQESLVLTTFKTHAKHQRSIFGALALGGDLSIDLKALQGVVAKSKLEKLISEKLHAFDSERRGQIEYYKVDWNKRDVEYWWMKWWVILTLGSLIGAGLNYAFEAVVMHWIFALAIWVRQAEVGRTSSYRSALIMISATLLSYILPLWVRMVIAGESLVSMFQVVPLFFGQMWERPLEFLGAWIGVAAGIVVWWSLRLPKKSL